MRRDVIHQPGITDVIVLEGRNDMQLFEPADVIAALTGLTRRLQARGLNVILGTFTPASSDAATGDSTEDRREINDWIRRQRVADDVVDFDRALRDPADPSRMRPEFDSGDGLHPSSAGYRKMARAVRLSTLKGPRCRPASHPGRS